MVTNSVGWVITALILVFLYCHYSEEEYEKLKGRFMGLSASTVKRDFPTQGYCFLCEQETMLTHHSSIQLRNVCHKCAKDLAFGENVLRICGYRRPCGHDGREPWDNDGCAPV